MNDSSDLTNLIDNVYEFAGLLHLAKRQDAVPEGLADIIRRRINDISSRALCLADSLEENLSPSDIPIEYSSPDIVMDSSPESVPAPESEPIRCTQQSQRRVFRGFSINDRFLFIRELFAGSRSDFDDVVGHIRTLNSESEALDYLLSSRSLDPENPNVVNFLKAFSF